MVRAFLLDRHFYGEVAASPEATGQAFLVVLLVSIATGIGSLGDGGPGLVPLVMVLVFVIWITLASLTYIIGATLFAVPATKAGWTPLVRALGFAQAPGILRLLGVVPVTGSWIALLANVPIVVAMIFAVREALSYESYWRAGAVVTIGFVIPWVIILVAVLVVLT